MAWWMLFKIIHDSYSEAVWKLKETQWRNKQSKHIMKRISWYGLVTDRYTSPLFRCSHTRLCQAVRSPPRSLSSQSLRLSIHHTLSLPFSTSLKVLAWLNCYHWLTLVSSLLSVPFLVCLVGHSLAIEEGKVFRGSIHVGTSFLHSYAKIKNMVIVVCYLLFFYLFMGIAFESLFIFEFLRLSKERFVFYNPIE